MEWFAVWCWIRMEKIIWTSHLRKEEVCSVKEERNILQTVQRRKVDQIDPILVKICLLKHVVGGR
jgi:hypothetical protein